MDVESRTVAEEAQTHPKYRPDIDGLRAIAVLSVLGYHAFPEWIHGGFIGVDIFFVISGFLISTIIFKSLSSNEFSFLEFYSRRVRRIFPALATVLLAVFIAGWFILYPDEYRQLGKHILGGAGFISNFVLWRESGYFDSAAEMKPLLHLWSLGIEEQFYIVFPLFAWLAWKHRLNVFTLVIVIGLLSFLLNVKYIYTDAIWTFYQPQTRVWELVIGSLLALRVIDTSGRIGKIEATLDRFTSKVLYRQDAGLPPGTALANSKAWLGALLLAVALYRINREFHFPGKWAVVPTVGAALVIWAGPRAFVNRCVLSNPLLVWVGKISYPLYLWHWVILVYLRISSDEVPSVRLKVAGIVAAVVVSWLTYRFIEKPLRFGARGGIKTCGLLIAMAAIAATGFASFKSNGFESLRINSALIHDLEAAKRNGTVELAAQRGYECFQLPPNKDFDFFKKNNCIPSENATSSEKSILIIGDSHSASLALGLRPWIANHGLRYNQISSGACELFDDDISDLDCQEYRRKTYAAIQATKPDILVVDFYWSHIERKYFKNLGHWPSFAEYLSDRFSYLSTLGAKKIILVGEVPTWREENELPLPDMCIKYFAAKGRPIPERTYFKVSQPSLNMDSTMRQMKLPPDFTYVSMKDVLCNSEGCLTRVGNDWIKDIVFWDYGHLTAATAKFVIDQKLGSVIMDVLAGPKQTSDQQSNQKH